MCQELVKKKIYDRCMRLTEQDTSHCFGSPQTAEESAIDGHILNLMEKGHTILPDPNEPTGELLLTTCDLDAIRRCLRLPLQPQK